MGKEIPQAPESCKSLDWRPIERLGDKPIWVLKYDIYFSQDGNFCDADAPGAKKFTDCHGWYESEQDALAVQRHFPDPKAYRLEKVHQRILIGNY